MAYEKPSNNYTTPNTKLYGLTLTPARARFLNLCSEALGTGLRARMGKKWRGWGRGGEDGKRSKGEKKWRGWGRRG